MCVCVCVCVRARVCACVCVCVSRVAGVMSLTVHAVVVSGLARETGAREGGAREVGTREAGTRHKTACEWLYDSRSLMRCQVARMPCETHTWCDTRERHTWCDARRRSVFDASSSIIKHLSSSVSVARSWMLSCAVLLLLLLLTLFCQILRKTQTQTWRKWRKSRRKHTAVLLPLFLLFLLLFSPAAVNAWTVTFGGCSFSGSDSGGPLSRSGVCPTTSGTLNLCCKGITSIPASAFDGLDACT